LSESNPLGIGRKKLIESICTQTWGCTPTTRSYNFNELLFVIQEMMSEEGRNYLEPQGTNLRRLVYMKFVEYLLYRNMANYDSMILLTGLKGAGKSSAAIMLAREWCKLIGIKFNPHRHIAYNNADVMNKIEKLNAFEPIICDESVRFATACLDGNTIIKTEKGNKKIKNIVGCKNFKVFSYNKQTKKTEKQIAEKCIKVKKDIVYELETEDGKKIRCTKEHKFLTPTGWKTLEELNTGDKIVTI
jgi:hypothetical protein